MICIGAQIVGIKLVEQILRAFRAAQFSTEDQSRRRIAKLAALEKKAARELTL